MNLLNVKQETVRKSSSIDNNKEAIKLCMEGQLSKACKRLLSEPLSVVNFELLNK